MSAEAYITRRVIERAGPRHTGFPAGPRIEEPQARTYEALFGLIDPPRDCSVHDTSWVGPAAALVSAVADLNHFYGQLLGGAMVSRSSPAHRETPDAGPLAR
ncbi:MULTISPECIES: hypothetical protein [Streptomyces]|uniref:hypothetical protein n=1 Tax=Streptomyces TaxID=1883 RepID=UPI003CF0AE1C